MTRQSPPPARRADVYDGHADYRADIESRQSPWSATGRGTYTQFVAVAAAIAGACLANWLFWPVGPDATNIVRVFALLGMIFGFFFGALCYFAAVGMFPSYGKRVALVTVVLLGAASWLLKERSDGVLEEREQRLAPQRAQRAEREVAIAWRKRIDERHLHGASVPPMLSVESDAERLRVTNTSSTGIECVEVRRVGSPGTNGVSYSLRTERGYTCQPIAAGATIAYRDLLDTAQRTSYVLEFRIGTPEKPDPTWWSDSALREWDRTQSERYAIR